MQKNVFYDLKLLFFSCVRELSSLRGGWELAWRCLPQPAAGSSGARGARSSRAETEGRRGAVQSADRTAGRWG